MGEFALYKGDDFITSGTIKELAKFKGVKEKTIKFYLTPSYKKRIENRKYPRAQIKLISIGDEWE